MTPKDDSAVPRFQPADVRQRQILDAAAGLSIKEGLDNVSIAQVAAAAGVAKGSIYLHYASRNELVDALRADLWHKMLDEPSTILEDTSTTAAEKLDLIVGHLVAFSTEHEELYHAVFHATAAHSDEPWVESRRLFTQLLRAGQQTGEFDIEDVDITADFLLHAYSGPCYHHDDMEAVASNLKQLFRRVVGSVDRP
ncbi:MAG: TetR/AcrR family transcriptional regulator [Acidimicrobiia bacterium]|nr:TetR/AcrR family transcriptional regulator [Acidimicrobiia bacterium]